MRTRVETCRPLIKAKLNQGVTLVLDRYAFSGVAFTSAKEVVDASKSIEDVHEEIRVLSEDAIRSAAQSPLEELWK
ncbi:Thymidylate kinase [Cricetulus griseus]|uniref:dTMP kinase n=1 Tax=Cricetulus griseus TaxID=10029 RepID=G3H4W0_CRIGR|nr:Thymidylate kinase [Cricetulus griseus]